MSGPVQAATNYYRSLFLKEISMKKGFTLLELVVVIIILGVLATLGIQQYARMIEKARGAEAKTIIGVIRSVAAGHRLQNGALNGTNPFTSGLAGIGTSNDQIPSACRGTHYFNYAVSSPTADGITITATRCTSGGKTPDNSSAGTMVLTTDFGTGSDVWTGTGGY